MDNIYGFFGKVPSLDSRQDGSFSDRLCHFYSVAFCIICAGIVSSKQYVGEPIQCWVPAHFCAAWETYTNNYCWIKNTYFLNITEQIPHEVEDERRHEITYYQWVPLILLSQALLFYLPVLLWRSFSDTSGMVISFLIEVGKKHEMIENQDARQAIMDKMSIQMDRFLNTETNDRRTDCTISVKNLMSRTCFRCCGRRQGNYLTALYIGCKFIFFASVLSQLFSLNFFLGYEFHAYGFTVVRELINEQDWTASPRFPRVTLCDFFIRRIGNLHRYTVQCVLPINLFNEKVFLVLWFWMLMVVFITALSLVQWIWRLVSYSKRKNWIKTQLMLMDNIKQQTSPSDLSEFIDEYLRADGVFILRLFAKNSSPGTTTALVNTLWEKFQNEIRDPDEDLFDAKKEKPGDSDQDSSDDDIKKPGTLV